MKSSCRFLSLALLFAFATSARVAVAATPEENYEQHCASCHGADGKAKTRLGRKSGAKDLTDKERMSKLTDADAFNGIKNGRKNAKGEEVMDSFKKELTDKEITELVAYVRTLAK